VSGADPLNLIGSIVPGEPVLGHSGNRVLYRDGVPVATIEGKGEGGRGKGMTVLVDATPEERRTFETALVRKKSAPLVRTYLGKSRAAP
jgi:ATP-dependent Lhr-like helicase